MAGPGMQFDPTTLQALMQSLPEVKKKQRRAEQLRDVQKKLEKQASDAQARGPQNYAPRQQGGLFPTVQQFQPDIGNAVQQGAGALGGYLMGRQADQAQGGADEAQAQAVLQAAQQSGAGLDAADSGQQGTVANDSALRAYIAMIGGPELVNSLGSGGARTTKTDEDGFIWTQMKNGEWVNSGIRERSGVRTIRNPIDGSLIQVSTTTQGGPHILTQEELRGQQLPAGAAGTPILMGSDAEIAGGKETAKINAQAAGAPALQTVEEAQKTGTLTAEARVAARQALPKALDSLAMVRGHVEKLKGNPVIQKITGATLAGRTSALPVIGGALNDMLLGAAQTEGKAGADANALINQLTDEAFLDAYADSMKGTGAISNVEGLKAAQSKLRSARYQSPEAFESALDEFIITFNNTVTRMQNALSAPTPAISAPTAAPQTVPAAEGGDPEMEALVKKWGG